MSASDLLWGLFWRDDSDDRSGSGGARVTTSDLLGLPDALALAWVALVFMAMAVPPLLVETVILGEGLARVLGCVGGVA